MQGWWRCPRQSCKWDPILALRGGESTVVTSVLPTSTESLGSYTVMGTVRQNGQTERHVADRDGYSFQQDKAKMECSADIARAT